MPEILTPEQVAEERRRNMFIARIRLSGAAFTPKPRAMPALVDRVIGLMHRDSAKEPRVVLQIAKKREPRNEGLTFNPHFKLTSLMDQPTLVALSPRYASLLKPPLRTFRTPENANDFQHWKIDAVRQVNQIVATTGPHCVTGEDEPGFHCTLEGMERALSAEECGELCQLFLNAGWPKAVVTNATLEPSILFVCVQLYPTTVQVRVL